MSRLRHEKSVPSGKPEGRHKSSASGSDFIPDRGVKYATKLQDGDYMASGGACKSRLARKRGGSVKREDGGNVTTVPKTNPSGGPTTNTNSYGQYLRARTRPAEPGERHVYSYPHGDGKKDGGKVGARARLSKSK